MENAKTICAYCHDAFDIWDTRVINRGIEGKELCVCNSCADKICNNGKIIQCIACGESFTADVLHGEVIPGHTFTACPSCGKDAMEGLPHKEFEDEYRPCRYAVIVRGVDGSQRGYVVSVESSSGIGAVVKKLAEKVNLSCAASVSVAEILLKEDEF